MTGEKFKAAAYCRLSRDDVNQPSESIGNQEAIIKDYIARHSDEFDLAEVFVDDGISGMTYDRAAYVRMMDKVNSGEINAIIVKDLSRIGREQIETLQLIKKDFILKNIRFIAINDDYDSFKLKNGDSLSTSVKLLLNDYYCQDISAKVRSAQQIKMKRGDFIGSYAPYGYVKSPENKNRLLIDEEAAAVVKRVFDLYVGGMGKLTIARLLNKEGILNPTMYKRSVLGQNYVNSNRLTSTTGWTYSTIHKLLNNPVYIGKMVQHKSQIKAYNLHKKILVPEAQQITVENTHEGIISKETFELAQKLLKNRRRRLSFEENKSKYTGLFFCEECGRAMHKFLSKPKKDGSRYLTYKCGTYSTLGKDACTIHSIKESELDEAILCELKRNIQIAMDEKTCELIKNNAVGKEFDYHTSQLKRLRKAKEGCLQKQKNMLGYLAEGAITPEDYKVFSENNTEEINRLETGLKDLKEKLKNQEERFKEYDRWVSNLLQYKDITEVNRELLVNLIDKIYISEKDGTKSLEILFKFKNPIQHQEHP